MDKHITYLLPSRQRHIKFINAVDNINKLSASDNYEIIGIADNDDFTMQEFRDEDFVSEFTNLKVYFGDSKTKIEACNAGIKYINPDSEIVVLFSDDFSMLQKGFDNVIREGYADGFRGCLHFPDGRVDNEPKEKHATGFYIWMNLHAWTFSMIGNGGYVSPNFEGKYTLPALYQMYYVEQKKRLITFPIMHREYLAVDGWIYHPRFLSVCSDDFQTELSKKRGQYKYVDKNIMIHEHYRNGFGLPDALMQHNDSGDFYKHDREILAELRIEFGL